MKHNGILSALKDFHFEFKKDIALINETSNIPKSGNVESAISVCLIIRGSRLFQTK
jgi:hypothetical protein